MPTEQRKKFKSMQDWQNLLNTSASTGQEINPLELRLKCYSDIETKRGRPLIVYATKFMGQVIPGTPNSIVIDDIDGFTDMINSFDASVTEIDVLVHSPGGSPDATERIVSILRNRFSKVHFLVPHSAYSAATMLALSGDTITLHPSAILGPIDPQIGGIPGRSILRGFEDIKEKITREGPESLPAYIPLIEKYSIELLEMCKDSEKLSKDLVTDWLTKYMFNNDPSKIDDIKRAVDFFSSYDEHLMHSRPINIGKIDSFGLKISIADQELSELLWEAYILLSGFFSVTNFVKLYENNKGISWGQQVQQVVANR